jgi:hypothetical protein
LIPGFGAHYRIYRLVVALERLRDMPPGTRLTLKRAAQMLGISDATVRALIKRYASTAALDGGSIDAAVFRRVVRQAYEARKQR